MVTLLPWTFPEGVPRNMCQIDRKIDISREKKKSMWHT